MCGLWFKDLDLSKISDDARYKLFEYIVNVKKLKSSDLSISYSTFSRVRNRKIPVSDSLLIKILQHITPEEFAKLVSAGERLRALGIVKEDGSIDYSLALEFVKLILRDEYLKNLVLRFVVQEFKEDIRKMLGVSFAGIKLEWSEDFENFLVERKKRRKVRDPETIKYYRNL
ncbi:MAG: integrase, partial [Ignisphaera sp.]